MTLTKANRTKILENVITKTMKDKIDYKTSELKNLLTQVMEARYPIDVIEWMNDKPDYVNEFSVSNHILFDIRNPDYRRSCIGETKYKVLWHTYLEGLFVRGNNVPKWKKKVTLNKSFKLLEEDRSRTIAIEPENEYYPQLLNCICDLDNLKEKQIGLTKVIQSALDSCTTVKKLEDNFPTLVDYIPESIREKNKKKLPVGLDNNKINLALLNARTND